MKPFLLLLISLLCLPAFGQEVQVLQEEMVVDVLRLAPLNSTSEETNLSVTPSGNTLFFMSDRGGRPWSQRWAVPGGPPRYDGDIWYSQKIMGRWNKAKCLSGAVNTGGGEDEPNVSPDGKRVVYQSWKKNWLLTGGPYYYSLMNGTFWSQPRGLGGGINRFFVQEFNKYSGYATDGASLSPDGKRFVVACGPDYFGLMDLYYSALDEFGEWSDLKKLPLSTAGNERSVFFGSDSRTLYFSSDGYGGAGGLDIFVTSLKEDGTTGPIINLGTRFNSPADDYGFIISGEGKEAFFVREGDIYQATIKNGGEALKPKPTALIKGKVTLTNGTPLSLKVSLVPQGAGQEQLTVYSDAVNGEYSLFVVDPSLSYDVEVKSEGMIVGKEKAIFNPDKLYSELEIDFRLPLSEEERIQQFLKALGQGDHGVDKEKIPVVKKEVFEYIYFSFGTAELSIKEQFRLNRIIAYLKKNPSQPVVISGYSDMRGAKDFKSEVSAQRALNVIKYLMRNGIARHRITGEHYPNAHHYGSNSSSPYQGVRKVEISFPEKNIGSVGGLPIDLSSVPSSRALDEHKQLKLALVELKKKIEADPKNSANYLERALVHAMGQDYEMALKDFDRALERRANLPEVAFYRASVKEKMNDLQGALFDYNKIIEREPKNALALFNRGSLKFRMSDPAGACRDWLKANQFAPGISDYQLRNNCN